MGMLYETIRKLNGAVTGDKAMAILSNMKWIEARAARSASTRLHATSCRTCISVK
jgi:hypothetical protein